jgi:hypothetical protein
MPATLAPMQRSKRQELGQQERILLNAGTVGAFVKILTAS